jgi:N-methylhydantoinase B
MTKLDAVQLEIIRHALVAAAEEMSVTVWRTSRSPIVRDILDYSTCIFDHNGQSIAQSTRIPVHLNSMASCLLNILEDKFPLDTWQEGDVVITNDPYSGGQHLPDIQTFKPVFLDGRLIAISAVLVHHLDVGGGAPGSYYASATEIYQEGFRIPPMKIAKAGVLNQEVVELLLRNCREPVTVGGDFNSQLAALETGAESIRQLARKYSPDTMASACERIQEQSELSMRAAVAEILDGVYEFEDFVDDDGIEMGKPLRIHVVLTISGEELHFDLSGSSAQAKGPVNCTYNMTDSAVVCGVLMSLARDIPANAGCYRPIRITAPEGLCVNARSPAPVANRMAVGHRVVNAVMGAFAQATPDKVSAAYYGVSYVYALNCIEEDGSREVYFDVEAGGWGGHPDEDGANGFSCGFHNLANAPVEMLENAHPITFTTYGLEPGSGGAGKHRGGLGLTRAFRVDSAAGTFSASLDRFTHPPYGLSGGEAGAGGRLTLQRAGSGQVEQLSSKVSGVEVEQGDILSLTTSGGGGWGHAADRDPAAVRDDAENGYTV